MLHEPACWSISSILFVTALLHYEKWKALIDRLNVTHVIQLLEFANIQYNLHRGLSIHIIHVIRTESVVLLPRP